MDVLEELDRIANFYRSLPIMRAEAVTKARAEGITWREIAKHLEMTEHGVIRADRAYRETQQKNI